ncbi:MAG: Eco57I restriction-modification methylase domain-containing protein, partial [Fervidobacterium sp.]
FYLYYDTELFKEKILPYVKSNEENIDMFYRNLQLVLGITYLQVPFGALKGIMQYNFRYIDEDVLGKAYETFLGEVRKDEGVYYTPKYVTQYIAENTVGRVFDQFLGRIEEQLEGGNLEDARTLVSEFISVRVLDPACGSGSFLIKAVRIIFNKYKELIRLLDDHLKKYLNYRGSLDIPRENSVKAELLSSIKDEIGSNSDRELIARILVRHIHGVDLDKRALEVAKVNIWLEAIKLAPKEFRYDKLPPETNFILPNLEMNLLNGDSLVGLPEEISLKYLYEKHRGEIARLSVLRSAYLENPVDPGYIEEIESIKNVLRKELDKEFYNFLNTEGIQIGNETKPFHWALEYWYVFFDRNGGVLSKEERGFHVVLGNPPYIDYRRVKPLSLHKFFKIIFESSRVPEKYNVYILFIEKGLKLLRREGKFGYINPVQWMGSLMALELRKLILNNYDIFEIDDLSTIGVFEEPTLTNLGLFFIKNEEPKELVRIGYKISKQHIVERNIPFVICKKSNLVIGDENIIMLDPSTNVNQLIRRMSFGTKLQDVVKLEWGTSQSGYGKKKISINTYKKLDSEKQKLYAPLVQTGDIAKHVVLWKGEFIDVSIYSDNRKRQFARPKIVFSRRAPRIECAFDNDGFYLGKVAFTAEMKLSLNYAFLLGVLNSSIVDFYFKKVYETLHPGGNLRFDIPYINKLPLVLPDKKDHLVEQIEQNVNRITILKRLRYEFLKFWGFWSAKLKTDEVSLAHLLDNETTLMRKGEFDKIWILKTTIFQNGEQAIMNKELEKIRVKGDSERAVLRFYGSDRDNAEELIYELELKNRELMSHIYFSLLHVLESRADVRTLSQLFNKTIIPIVKEVNRDMGELTPNVVRKSKDELKRWLKEKGIGDIEADIVKIDSEIEDLEAKIDALVCKLYGLNEDEIKIVFDALKTSAIYQNKVFEFFKAL